MKKLYIIAAISCFPLLSFCQIVNIPDANFKAKLLTSAPGIPIANGSTGGYIAIDANGNGEIEVSEAAVVSWLVVENAAISSLEGIESFPNLKFLSCKNNNLSSFDLSSLTQLEGLDCSNNQLSAIDISQLSVTLKTLYCNNNFLTTLNVNSLINLNQISCNYNLLTTLNVNSLSNLSQLSCTNNQLTSLNAEQINNKFTLLDCSYNNLTSLIVPNFFPFEDMGYQQLYFGCGNNQLSQITFNLSNGSEDFSGLNLANNNFTNLDLSNIHVYGGGASVSNNPLTNLTLTNFSVGPADPDDSVGFGIVNTNLSQIKLPPGVANSWTTVAIKDNPNLVSLEMKNGRTEVLLLENNLSLSQICCDENEITYLSSLLPNAQVTEYCTFAPGGNYNTIQGSVILNCPNGNTINSNVKVLVNNSFSASFLEGENTYQAYTTTGLKTVIVNLPNPSYFTVTPSSHIFNFNNFGNIETANFCLTPNGVHNDLEIVLLPLMPSRPGFDSRYKIVYTNKGTQTSSGNITFDFDDSILDFVSADPVISSQSLGNLSWSFSNLAPFESRSITFTVNVNSPQENPAVNLDDVLQYTANIYSSEGVDETPADNEFDLSQIVIGSYDPNDKLVTEGTVVDINKVGDYLHYMIRFQNTGTAPAENVVVKDLLPANLNVQTLRMISSSHAFTSRLTGSRLEFIFEGINLPASTVDEIGSNGFVAFKIKPASSVVLGSTIENTASIYFDYNFPIITNTTSTTFENLLKTDNFDRTPFELYPNPAKNVITISISSAITIQSIAIYNPLGQLVKTLTDAELVSSSSIDVSTLKTGTYFMEINSNQGKTTQKFIKL